MKQFNLEEWLENPSRKVVTRDGRSVRIVCWDAPTKNPIYGFVEGDDGITSWRKDGRFSNLIDNVDLFFADEEKLTEFEKEVKDFINSCCNEIKDADITNELVKEAALYLLDLARKELQPEFEAELNKAYKTADNVQYQKGKQDALKNLPKWKKVDSNPPKVQYNLQGKRLYKNGEYYIELSDLETLPKEE